MLRGHTLVSTNAQGKHSSIHGDCLCRDCHLVLSRTLGIMVEEQALLAEEREDVFSLYSDDITKEQQRALIGGDGDENTAFAVAPESIASS